MAIPRSTDALENQKFLETTVANQPGVVVINPDGSNILGASATGSIAKVEDAAHSSGDVGAFVLAKRTDTAAVSGGTDGDYSSLNVDSSGALWSRELNAPVAEDNTNGVIGVVNKPLAVSTYSPTVFSNAGANATLNVKASAGNVYGIKCHNLNAAARYIQLHNTATVPGGGATALWWALVPANTEVVFGIDWFTPGGMNFSTGIAFAFSTTESTYTAGTATDQMTFVNYK